MTTSIADVVNAHVEIWDDDCHEHGGCSCGWQSTIRRESHGCPEYLPDGVDDHALFPSRVEWRDHLVEVITNRHISVKDCRERGHDLPPLVRKGARTRDVCRRCGLVRERRGDRTIYTYPEK